MGNRLEENVKNVIDFRNKHRRSSRIVASDAGLRSVRGEVPLAADIEAAELSTFEIASDGSRCRMHVVDTRGRPASIDLPSHCLTKLIMTLPRMATAALRAEHRDDSLRIVYPVERMRLEQAATEGTLILTLATPDGFEVSFSLQADELLHIQQSAVARDFTDERLHLVKN